MESVMGGVCGGYIHGESPLTSFTFCTAYRKTGSVAIAIVCTCVCMYLFVCICVQMCYVQHVCTHVHESTSLLAPMY